ncbi:MAG TPA: response regulator [Polyangiaceae bacterium]|nr:response regulator [Polyangiaceae bacterium]
MSENRRGTDLRVRVAFRVRFRSIDQLVMALTGDLSRGGMRLSSPQKVEIGSRVSVNVSLPDAGPEMTVLCEVVTLTPHKSGEGFSIGVKFVDPNGDFQQRIEWFILNSEPAERQFGQHPHRRQLKLVVADDDPLQAEATAKPFLGRGDNVLLAADGLEALGLCLKEKPDVLLTDVHMPKMDGWQLLRMVRARPQLAGIPVLFLTTLASESDHLLGYRLGVDDYLAKPCAPSALLERIDRAALRATQAARSSQGHVEPGALRGDLQLVGLASVLSFLELERKSGVVRVGPDANGVIYLRDGVPVHIAVDGVSDDAAPEERFAPLISARSGRFEFRPGAVDRADTVKRSLGMLLLECARRADEAAR